MADRFYTPEALHPGDFALAGPEAHHLSAVRRIGVGETIVLFNGDGNEYPAEVLAVGKKSVQLVIGSPIKTHRERSVPQWIASAIPKGDRIDFLIEKLTELGVTRYIPLITERSVVRPKADVVEKYERMVVEASKQCGRNILMTIEPPTPWMVFANRTDLPEQKCILHPSGDTNSFVLNRATVFAVGPEGGFTPVEVNVSGWTPIGLGPRILRIETAAIAAAARYSF